VKEKFFLLPTHCACASNMSIMLHFSTYCDTLQHCSTPDSFPQGLLRDFEGIHWGSCAQCLGKGELAAKG